MYVWVYVYIFYDIINFQILTVKLGAVGGVGGSSPSSPDSSSDSSPPPTPQLGEGPNLEAEQCLPGVVSQLIYFFISDHIICRLYKYMLLSFLYS